ncbi:MAG: hypothetical protein OXC46_02265, partial [Thaumarchaeota archaeon]|nr:hypothetical protein [Nitrososphaerota archaeon]
KPLEITENFMTFRAHTTKICHTNTSQSLPTDFTMIHHIYTVGESSRGNMSLNTQCTSAMFFWCRCMTGFYKFEAFGKFSTFSAESIQPYTLTYQKTFCAYWTITITSSM